MMMRGIFLTIFVLLAQLPATASTCRALMFNGAPQSSCASGLNDASYEMDLLQYQATLGPDCQGTTLSGAGDEFSCLSSSAATERGLEKKKPDGAATAERFATEFSKGLDEASFTGDSMQLYMTDHGGEGKNSDFISSTFNVDPNKPNDENEISYYSMAKVIREANGLNVRTDEDGNQQVMRDDIIRRMTNVHAVLDHCNSGGGLSLLMKAGLDSVGSKVCGVAAAEADDWSFSANSLGTLRYDFFKEFGRAPSDGELYRMSLRHACYPSVPQLSSDLYLKDVVFSGDAYPEEKTGKTIFVYSLDTSLMKSNVKNGLCLARGISLPDTPNLLEHVVDKIQYQHNKKMIEQRLAGMADDFKLTIEESKDEIDFSSCGILDDKSLNCFLTKIEKHMKQMENTLDRMEMKHKIELNLSIAKELGIKIPNKLKNNLKSKDKSKKGDALQALEVLVSEEKNKLFKMEERLGNVIHHLCESDDKRCKANEHELTKQEQALQEELLAEAKKRPNYNEAVMSMKQVCQAQEEECKAQDLQKLKDVKKCKEDCYATVTCAREDIACHSRQDHCENECGRGPVFKEVEQCKFSFSNGLFSGPQHVIHTERIGMGYRIGNCQLTTDKCDCEKGKIGFLERENARDILYSKIQESPARVRKILDKQREIQFAQWNKEGAYKAKFKNLRRAKSSVSAISNLYKLLQSGKAHELSNYAQLLDCENEGVPSGEVPKVSMKAPKKVKDCQ